MIFYTNNLFYNTFTHCLKNWTLSIIKHDNCNDYAYKDGLHNYLFFFLLEFWFEVTDEICFLFFVFFLFCFNVVTAKHVNRACVSTMARIVPEKYVIVIR